MKLITTQQNLEMISGGFLETALLLLPVATLWAGEALGPIFFRG